jgi:hypothetical protein
MILRPAVSSGKSGDVRLIPIEDEHYVPGNPSFGKKTHFPWSWGTLQVATDLVVLPAWSVATAVIV